jgi:hypothetical protein
MHNRQPAKYPSHKAAKKGGGPDSSTIYGRLPACGRPQLANLRASLKSGERRSPAPFEIRILIPDGTHHKQNYEANPI